MESRKVGLALTALAVALAVVLFIVLSDDEDGGSTEATVATTTMEAERDGGGGGADAGKPEKPEKPQKPDEPDVPTIVVEGGEPVGGVAELEFPSGGTIRFVVESDVADHVHLHGYDVFQDVAAGGKASFEVPATLEGVFEVELEDRGKPLAEISVVPD